MGADIFKTPLRRDRHRSKIAGVCAGVARSLEVEPWVVRLAVVLAFLFTAGGPIIIAYLIAYLLLDADGPIKPGSTEQKVARCVSDIKGAVSDKVKSSKPKHDIQVIENKLHSLKKRLEVMEAEVTSSRFILEQELHNIKQ